MGTNRKHPRTPGEVLREDFMRPRKLSFPKLATMTGFEKHTLWSVVEGRRHISVRLAEALAKALGTTADFWLGLQLDCDMHMLRCSGMLGATDRKAFVERGLIGDCSGPFQKR